jgi:hypothetical protein
MAVSRASYLKKRAPNGHFYLQWAAKPGERALKAVKTLWGLISRLLLELFFLNSQCHHKKQEESFKEIQVKSRYS